MCFTPWQICSKPSRRFHISCSSLRRCIWMGYNVRRHLINLCQSYLWYIAGSLAFMLVFNYQLVHGFCAPFCAFVIFQFLWNICPSVKGIVLPLFSVFTPWLYDDSIPTGLICSNPLGFRCYSRRFGCRSVIPKKTSLIYSETFVV